MDLFANEHYTHPHAFANMLQHVCQTLLDTICSGPAICHRACVMAKSQRGVRNPLIQINLWIAAVSQIDLWSARFTGLIWALLCISLGSILAF